ncbi:hypothetical protein AGJ34_20265 [Cronobacter dublinensis subsp. dublinensis]|nr:hypothetical protein [Cronobacter dublinensis subsp. dublinensis]
MFEFFPIMFAVGRVTFNRFWVTVTDFLVVFSVYLSVMGVIYWTVCILFALTLTIYYLRVGYTRYFKLVEINELLKANVFYENGFITASLTFKETQPYVEHDSFTIPLNVKAAYGGFYHRYVLYIYMSLCNSLVLYARKINIGKNKK